MEESFDEVTETGRLADWARRLNLRHLQILITLAELGTLSDTARAVSTSQPALSKWLKELEESVGWALFERLPRGLTPTHHGTVLVGYARRVLNEMSRAQVSLAALNGGSVPRVIVGTTPPTSASLLPTAINELLRLHPKAKVSVWENSMGFLLEKLEQGALDLVVGGMDDAQPAASLKSELLYRETIQAIARPKHPLTLRRTALEWEDLYAFDWVVWPVGTPVRGKLELALSRAGRQPLPYRVESSSLAANFALIETTDMLGVVSARLAAHFAGRGRVVPLGFQFDADSAVGIFSHGDSIKNTVVGDFADCLREAAGSASRKSLIPSSRGRKKL